VTIFGADWSELELEHVEAFLAEAGGEPLLWEAKGTELPRPDSVAKHACGFGNAVDGGYLLLGFERDGGTWNASGSTSLATTRPCGCPRSSGRCAPGRASTFATGPEAGSAQPSSVSSRSPSLRA
jgi:hypothetical protein